MGKSNSMPPNPLLAYCGVPGRPHQRLSCLGSRGDMWANIGAGVCPGVIPSAPLGQTCPLRLPVCKSEMFE